MFALEGGKKPNFFLIFLALAIFLFFAFKSCARAEGININALCNAIYKAENSKSHPYGIMIKCKNPRQVCINTIKHALKDFKSGDFIAFLGSRYCPVGCSNDNGTNKYWVRNVKFLYAKELR